MNLPHLSVIVANHNHGHHLPTRLGALLNQSLLALEVLVIDDGSTDNSWAVIEDFAGKHPAIRPLRNDGNRGVAYTLNRGLDLVTGDYVYLAAADDYVQPAFFESSLRLLAQHPDAALSCTASEWRDARNELRWLMGAQMADGPCYLSPDELVCLGRRNRLTIVSHSAIMKLLVVREFGGFRADLKWHCDWFLTYASAFRHGLCYVPETLSVVNLSDQSYYDAGRQGREHAYVMDRLLELLDSNEYHDVRQRILASGALALHSTPMLRALWRKPECRDLRTPLFLRQCLWRRLQVTARHRLPNWLAKFCIRLFVPQVSNGQSH